ALQPAARARGDQGPPQSNARRRSPHARTTRRRAPRRRLSDREVRSAMSASEATDGAGRLWPAVTEGQAYLLGILAGGFVDSDRGTIELEVTGSDKRIARLLERFRIGRVALERGRLRVRGKHLESDLAAAGLPVDRAWQLPELPEPLRNAFVRGLFDVRGHLPEPSEAAELSCALTTRSGLREALTTHYAGASVANTGALVTLS